MNVDETYVGGKNKNRHTDKKVEFSQGPSTKDKTPVFGMVEREGKLNAKVVKDTTCETLTRETVRYVKDTLVCTDEWWGYNSIKKQSKNQNTK